MDGSATIQWTAGDTWNTFAPEYQPILQTVLVYTIQYKVGEVGEMWNERDTMVFKSPLLNEF